VETKLCVGERLLRRFSVQGEGQASTRVAWRCFSTGQRSSKRFGGGSGSWGRLVVPAQFGRLIRTGGAPIYRGNPSTRSGRGDDLDSISNLMQTRRIAKDFGKGINSVWRTLCGYERCRVELRFLAGRVGSVREGVGLSWAASCFARGEGRPASAGPRWAAPEWGEKGWLLGQAWFPAGFQPTAKIELKIPFLFPNLFIICKLI
jgi:hypothetical protein